MEVSVELSSMEAFMEASVEVASVAASVEAFMEASVEVASVGAFVEASVEASVEAFMESSTALKRQRFRGSFHGSCHGSFYASMEGFTKNADSAGGNLILDLLFFSMCIYFRCVFIRMSPFVVAILVQSLEQKKRGENKDNSRFAHR